jgi:hypothetical protein
MRMSEIGMKQDFIQNLICQGDNTEDKSYSLKNPLGAFEDF